MVMYALPLIALLILYLSHLLLRTLMIGRIYQNCDTSHRGHELVQKLQPLRHQFAEQKIDAREIASRPGKACRESKLHWIIRDHEHDRNGRSRRLGCDGRSGTPGREDDRDLFSDQIRR